MQVEEFTKINIEKLDRILSITSKAA